MVLGRAVLSVGLAVVAATVGFGLRALSAQAGLSPSLVVTVLDEGTAQGPTKRLDCVGAGVTCSRSGVTGTVSVSGGGGGGDWNKATKTADQSNSTTTGADVTDLGVSLAANQVVHARWTLIASSATRTTGVQTAINGPASPVRVTARQRCDGTTAQSQRNTNAYEDYLPMTSAPTGRMVCFIDAVVENGPNGGTLIARFRSSADGSAVTIHRESFVEWF